MEDNNPSQGFLFKLALLSLLLTIMGNLSIFFPKVFQKHSITDKGNVTQTDEQDNVLGWWGSQKPVIYISGGTYKYSSGGLIPLASTDEPVVEINTYNVSGSAKFELFEADQDSLFAYLLYKDDNQQVNNEVDSSKFSLVTSFDKEISSSDKVSLPLKDRGIYFLKVSTSGVTTNSYILRSNIASVVKEAGEEYVFWSQDLNSKRSLTSGNVKIYNFKSKVNEIANVSINDEGIAKTRLTAEADVAFVYQGEELAVVPINLRYLNTGYDWDRFQDFKLNKRYFSFTDRPLYRPGDTVYFKSIIRDEDDVRFRIPSGTVNVVLTSYGLDAPIYVREIPVSASGAVAGEVKLPQDLKKGSYYFSFGGENNWESRAEFEVQEFRKPEYFIELTADKREYVSGDKVEIAVSGQYFSGQPLANVEASYKVMAADFYDYEYYDYIGRQVSDDYRYGWWGRDEIDSGKVVLDSKGRATVSFDTKSDINKGQTQVYSVEVHYQDVSSDQAFDRKNILVYPGEYGIYRKNYFWSVKAGDKLAPVFRLGGHGENVNLAQRKIKAVVEGETYEAGSRNYYSRVYEKVLEKEISTNSAGEAVLEFVPQKEGEYKIILETIDDRGNEISKTFYFYATDKNYARYTGSNPGRLSLTADKAVYEPGDLANVVLYSAIANRDIFLTFERDRLNRYQVVRLNGNSTTLSLPLISTDMPNIYLTAASFSNNELETVNENIKVSAERMRLQVRLTPDGNKYKPGDTAYVDIETRDANGYPIAADVAIWAVDKAIYELEPTKLRNVYDTFWFERYLNTQSGHSLEGIIVNQAEGGGCFAAGTKVLLSGGSEKNIEDVKVGDTVSTLENSLNGKKVNAKVKAVSKKEVFGYFIINGKLKLTDNHILLVNGLWKEAASIRHGDILATVDGQEIVNSIEWHLGKTFVYNLEIEGYQTFFADGIYVHNQKGGASREILEDTAYWNPSVWTDTDGRARVAIKLPDNLTTWAISAVAATPDTKVGQEITEVIVTKDIIVRPIIPNILREGDEIVLSALVQNFTDSDKTFNVELEFTEGEVAEAEKKNVAIESQGTQQLFWKVKPTQVKEEADLRFIAYEVDNITSGDNILRKIPVKRFGFKETAGYAGNGDKEYKINLHQDSVNSDTNITLNIAPTVLGSLPASMKYLIDYPYGCIEQTTSRFVPSLIVKKHQDLFPELLQEKDIDGIIEKGLARLSSLQQANGGWSWWYGDGSAYISAYVVEYLLQARELGYEVDETMLARAKNYFENLNPSYENLNSANEYDAVSAYYALTLLGSDKAPKQLKANADINDFLLGMLVIANKRNSVNDNNANGYNELVSRAKFEGDAAYWDNDGNKYFSSIDGATAMAIRAILEAGGDRNLAVKAVNYLARSRNKQYWSNTYATAQAIRAIVDLSTTGDEQSPNYTYNVEFNGKNITSGRVSSANQIIKKIEISPEDLDTGNNTLKVQKSGAGQMYTTLVIDEFRTDRNFVPVGKALQVTREIVNDKDEYKSLGVGEVARVKLTIEGLKDNSEYIVVEDTLPSGMVPLIESFKNEQFDNKNSYYWGREYKADGVIFSSSYWNGGTPRVLEYRARVINAGDYWVPPATVELMYSPEVNGQSKVDHFTIENDVKDLPRSIPDKTISKLKSGFINLGRNGWLALAFILIALVVVVEKKYAVIRKLREKYKSRRTEVVDNINIPNEKTPEAGDGNKDGSSI